MKTLKKLILPAVCLAMLFGLAEQTEAIAEYLEKETNQEVIAEEMNGKQKSEEPIGKELCVTSSGEKKVASITNGEDRLWMLHSETGAQMLSIVMQTKQGNLIVIDGGWEGDGTYLKKTLLEKGGHVSAWLLTHPHEDHIGALYDILKTGGGGIAIDHIYESFQTPGWYHSAQPDHEGMAGVLLSELDKLPAGVVVNDIGKGTEIRVDDVTIRVMNDRYELPQNPVNNSSIVYQMKVNGKTLLFLGDLGYEGGERLLSENPGNALKADIVQMAHHGQQGVGRDVYAAVDPQICLWPTPLFLWNNDNGGGIGSGPWKTLETRRWMNALHVKQNYNIANGDVTLIL